MLSDSPHFKNRKSSKSRAVTAITNKRWSDSQKIECVKTYLMLGGNGALTIATLKIPEQTFYQWKRSEWWHTLENEIKQEERLELSAKLKKIMNSSYDVVADRLENGDWFYDQKTGELRRKPVAFKDAAKVAADTAIIRTKLDVATSFTVAADQIEDKLAKLAKAFEALSNKGKNTEVIDVETVEVIENDPITGDPEYWDEDLGPGDSGSDSEGTSTT